MSKSDRERGSVLVTVAITLVVLMSFLALAIDVGVGYVERRRIQAVADAAALAGAAVLTDNGTDAQILAAVNAYALLENPLAANELSRIATTQWLNYITPVGTVGVGARPAAATGILVTVTGRVSTVFANVFGIRELSASAQGGGGFSPLDVMVVLDESASMDDDSCLLKGVISPNPLNMRSYFQGGAPCQATAPYYDVTSSNCVTCKGTWRTSPNRCTWPNGTTMGSEVIAICGTLTSTSCPLCKGVWNTPLKPVSDLQTAASGFVDLVQAQLGPTDPHMGLVSYSDIGNVDVNLLMGTSHSLSTVKSAINNLAIGTYTNCEDGLYDARVELTTSGRQRWTAAKVILFMSDGNANRCRLESGCTEARADQLAIAEATTAGSLGIQVYTIGLGTSADAATLQQMATVSGGAYVYAATGTDLGPAFATLFQKIKRLRLVQ